jgi:hypothetical protein
MDVISIIMAAGKSSVDVALYTLLPIMVIMLIIMKYLEVRGILDVIVRWVAPLLKPFGLTGMSAFALIQINFVSFAAPLATLSIMDKRGVSDRQMAATLAMVFAMGQGNVFYPHPFWSALAGLDRYLGGRRAVRGRRRLARHRTALIGRRESPRGSAAQRRAKQPGHTGGDQQRRLRRHPPGARRSPDADPVVNHRRTAAGRRGHRPAAAGAEAGTWLAAYPAELCAAGAGEVRRRGHRLLWRHF